jgi:phenylalanyl-tRNA synthetase beta subunit
LRIYGYNNIDSQLPVGLNLCPLPERNEERLLERRLKAFLASKFGFLRFINYSFVGSEQSEAA